MNGYAAANKQTNDPQGTWQRGGDGREPESKLTLKDGRFRWYMPDQGAERNVSVTLEGDYSVTKDSIVYGIVTKVTLSHTGKAPKGYPEEEDTFCFRFRVDDDEMNVKGLKGKGFEELKAGPGRYRRKIEPSRPKAKGK